VSRLNKGYHDTKRAVTREISEHHCHGVCRVGFSWGIIDSWLA
jgi:hypothetical protein